MKRNVLVILAMIVDSCRTSLMPARLAAKFLACRGRIGSLCGSTRGQNLPGSHADPGRWTRKA